VERPALQGWEWDETLFAGSAAYYTAGRMPYPPALAEALRLELGLDGTGALLDVGCGPGSMTLLLAPHFKRAVGVDADADMIARARHEARRAGVGNVHWHHMRAEDLPGELGRFRVVTFVQSFHWVDRPRVAGTVREMLEQGGACVLVGATTHEGVPGEDPLLHPRPPRAEIAALITRYLGAVRRAGQRELPWGTPSGEDEIMHGAGFRAVTRLEVGGGVVVTRSADEVVASVFSLSSAAPHLFGERLAEFEREVRGLLHGASPSGQFSERTREIALDVWRI